MRDILEDIVECQRLAVPDAFSVVAETMATSGLAQPVESLRRAYRERNGQDGRCRSCPRPTAPGRKSCREHLAANARRAMRSQGYAAPGDGADEA